MSSLTQLGTGKVRSALIHKLLGNVILVQYFMFFTHSSLTEFNCSLTCA